MRAYAPPPVSPPSSQGLHLLQAPPPSYGPPCYEGSFGQDGTDIVYQMQPMPQSQMQLMPQSQLQPIPQPLPQSIQQPLPQSMPQPLPLPQYYAPPTYGHTAAVSPPAPVPIHRLAGPVAERRKRSIRTVCACESCRSLKIKCDGEQPCQRCVERNLACEYVPSTTAAIDKRFIIHTIERMHQKQCELAKNCKNLMQRLAVIEELFLQGVPGAALDPVPAAVTSPAEFPTPAEHF